MGKGLALAGQITAWRGALEQCQGPFVPGGQLQLQHAGTTRMSLSRVGLARPSSCKSAACWRHNPALDAVASPPRSQLTRRHRPAVLLHSVRMQVSRLVAAQAAPAPASQFTYWLPLPPPQPAEGDQGFSVESTQPTVVEVG